MSERFEARSPKIIEYESLGTKLEIIEFSFETVGDTLGRHPSRVRASPHDGLTNASPAKEISDDRPDALG